MSPIIISIVIALLGLGWVALTAQRVLAMDEGNAEMKRIGAAIRAGAQAFLRAEYRVLVIFAAAVAIIIALTLSIWTAIAYIVGAFTSALTGFIGMSIATRANTRTAAAAMKSLDAGLRVAFGAGSVMGMSVVSVGLLGLSLFVILLAQGGTIGQSAIDALTGYSFGASSIALFARVGGGIYTKAADVGADLVGKVEAGIPEDDPRNPAVIADNVGDNVGDVAGMGADLYESYVGSIVAASAIAVGVKGVSAGWATLPFLVAGVGLIASLIGSFMVRTKEGASQEDLLGTLRRAIWTASGLAIIGFVALFAMDSTLGWPIFGAIVVGLASGLGISYFTEYYTSYTEKPTQGIAESSQTGPATVIISGLAVGMHSTLFPTLIVAAGVIIAYLLGQMVNKDIGGLYAVALAGVGMLATLGITLATDAYGPVADNSGGIAEMAHLDKSVRVKTDALDSLGNTTAAVGKGFAIGSAVLTALGLLAAFAQSAKLKPSDLTLLDPKLLGALLIGSMLPFLFAAMTMTAVGKAAMGIVNEVRRQFREIKGLMEGTALPDYERCVAISTQSALREMVVPGVMAVIVPLAVGIILGPAPLAGMLVGAISTGFVLAVMMANAGGAWDNAKKYIETGEYGGKGSNAHKAAVVGDTVGDPFKDTSGPSLNILIKLMTVVSLVFAPLFVQIGGLIR
ncbi:MAG: sodium-translocating pyrophosphatase [Chloroflexi bacterium]|jgi:K(+)-stimulated pyrophosphate-energized sodium pump|nr:sodium-translocating pyrophosphatase [Chloroflexota bacterium]